jgi:nucleotide-binding universal stress UspA family protein
MYRKILVGFDGSDSAREALRQAVDLATTFGAELHCISVEGRLPAYAATLGEVDEAKAEKDRFFSAIEREAVTFARAQGVDLHPVKMVGEPADRIVHYAEEGGFDLIVLGEKGHSRAHRFLLGDTSDKVVDHAPCSTLIVRRSRS